MAERLVPASFICYRTLFTHAVLDDFRLANLECKVSAYQYFQKLQQQTAPMAPDSVPNLYSELRRLSHVWRWLKKLKWAGMGHGAGAIEEPQPGQLANFCLACPQPGVNISASWPDDCNRWVYQHFFVADGNFKADHVRQINPSSDIWLSEGGGMMSKHEEYQEFLWTATERLTVSGHCSPWIVPKLKKPVTAPAAHRKPPVRTISEQLKWLCCSPKHVTSLA